MVRLLAFLRCWLLANFHRYNWLHEEYALFLFFFHYAIKVCLGKQVLLALESVHFLAVPAFRTETSASLALHTVPFSKDLVSIMHCLESGPFFSKPWLPVAIIKKNVFLQLFSDT